MSLDDAGKLVGPLSHPFGYGFALGIVFGVVIGGSIVFTFVTPIQVALYTKVESGEKIIALKEKQESDNKLNTTKAELQSMTDKADQLQAKIEYYEDHKPLDVRILRPDVKDVVLGGVEVLLYFSPTIKSDGSYEIQIRSPVFGSNTAYFSSPEPISFGYNSKPYLMMAELVKPYDLHQVRLTILEDK